MSETQENELFASPDMWLLNLGYISENSEQNLLLYGYISSQGVVNVELMVDAANWLIKYAVVLNAKSYRRFRFQRWLEKRSGLFFKLTLFCLLKIFGSCNPHARIARCVRDYAGKRWKTQVEVISVKQYNKTISDDRTKGWFFSERIDEGGAVYQPERNPGPTAPGV